jgi:hypothetical protein
MLPSHKWLVRVLAGSQYPDLTYNFRGNDIALEYENDELGMQFFAYSYHVDELDDPVHVSQRLYSLQILLNGALRLNRGVVNARPIKFTQFESVNGGLAHFVNPKNIEEDPFSQNPKIDHEQNNSKCSYSAYLLNLSKSDADLRFLLFLVGLISTNSPLECILTWGTLYKILDTVRHHSKVLNLSINKFSDNQKINAFTAACNNMSILGVYARHGAASNVPPTRVITDLDEAIKLIISMATKFCREYVKMRYPKLDS